MGSSKNFTHLPYNFVDIINLPRKVKCDNTFLIKKHLLNNENNKYNFTKGSVK